ncbi:hypothetical protein MSG28_009715 [Choristoneura fumiferana]|uniref:Uncharacterized protein n=1 Tax=Choristoneura fumiferana TaxID=7141 RepID=A0ACC0JCC8_CHOFU|nr:hypothetical protein MSG28_009715 [Choristoneura fumiferana]
MNSLKLKIAPSIVTSGAICDDGDFLLEAAFKAALEAVSSEEEPYEAYVERTTPGDVLEAHTAMCSVLEANVFGVLGPTNINALKHVQSIADFVELPQILIDTVVTQSRNWSAINLYPNHVAFSQVFADIIEAKGWEEFTLIYEGTELLPFFDSILALQDLETDKDILKTIVQLPDDADYRTETLPELLLQAQQVGIMSDEHSYIIMNPDFQTIDTDPFKHGGANITGVRFFDPSLESIQTYIKSINEKVAELTKEQIEDALAENGLTLNLALIYDAVTVYVAGIKATALEDGSNVTCEDNQSWNYGSSLLNTIKTIEEEGLTGLIKFDDDGFRSDFEVEVLEIMPHGFEKVGSWNIEDGYEETRTIIPPVEAEGTESMKGKHFIILTALSAPYGMLKESSEKLEGNDRYEGFGIELIEELAIMNEFNYTFDIQADGVYGSLDKTTGKWSGMMEKVMDGVWGWIAGAYVGVSLLLFFLGRIAPEEWQNPYPCIEEPETLDNQFTMANSFWFTLGSVLTQGSEIAPIAVSTRMAGSMWWFFTLIMVSSYTANLAAFLTVESKFYAIKTVQDLANNPYGITYGSKRKGATFGFFKDDDDSSGEAQPLVLANVGGVFIVLAAGSGLAVFCAFLEMIVSFLEELKAELKFIITGDAETKPVRHREPSGSGSCGSKKSKADDEESQKDDDDRLNPVPTPRSERSAQSHHSRHTLHSRRQSNAVQMARMRKFSKATY